MRPGTAFVPMLLAGSLLAGLSLADPARAQGAPPPEAGTVLKLAETATVTARPDELAASLRAEAVAGNPADAQAKINTAIADALARAKAAGFTDPSTGGYSVYRAAPAAGDRTDHWQAGQSLELHSRNGPALLKLVGELQKTGLAVHELDWRLSPEVARKARAEATRLALAGLRGRAEEAAGEIGLAFERFREIRLDSDRPAPFAPRMMAAMSAAPAPPSAEAQDVIVSATAEADVLLRPR